MSDSHDAYRPSEMAERVLQAGVDKAGLSASHTVALAVLAGAFIALGAAFSTVATASSTLPFGVTRTLAGVTFCLGLILVVVAGAELFTGNNLVAMAWASRVIKTRQVLRNWALVYAGNFLGSVGTVLLVYGSRTFEAGQYAVGRNALAIAAAKCQLTPTEAFARGVLCNALVCLAVWLCYSARTTTDKILAVLWPITAFVALGFEHSVANMYFIPLGILLRNDPELAGVAGAHAVNAQGLMANLVPVTLGNIVGGTLLVAGVYWFVYLRSNVEATV
ncbi:MAG: formate/nitrite transporter family protein [Longimicrobiales bacterium]